jgi:hypothetical protein
VSKGKYTKRRESSVQSGIAEGVSDVEVVLEEEVLVVEELLVLVLVVPAIEVLVVEVVEVLVVVGPETYTAVVLA